jgi:hypothetical protein
MDAQRFDDLARRLAGRRSRRSFLGMVAAGVAALVAGSGPGAAATRAPRPYTRARRCGGSHTVPCEGLCCGKHDSCVAGGGCVPASSELCGTG